jgi:hypothetical protein
LDYVGAHPTRSSREEVQDWRLCPKNIQKAGFVGGELRWFICSRDGRYETGVQKDIIVQFLAYPSQYVLPLAINLSGSAAYYYTLGKAGKIRLRKVQVRAENRR